MTSFLRLLPVAMIPVILLSTGCRRENTFVPPPPPRVTVQRPEQRDVTTYLKHSGRTVAHDFVELRARVRGYLQSIEFDDGQLVEKGDLLFVIEPEPFEVKLAAAKARLEEAEARLQLAEASLQRIKKAYETKAVSEIDLLTAEAEKNSSTAGVLEAEAAVKSAEIDLSYTRILAPVSGRTSQHNVSVGNLVGGTEATLLATIVVDNPIYVEFHVDERTILSYMGKDPPVGPDRPRALPKVLLELADGSRYPLPGEIDYVDNQVDPATGTLLVRAVFDNPNAALAPGLFATILFPREQKGALLVPRLAVQRDLAGPYVLTVDEENIVHVQHVVPGPTVGDQRIIEEKLAPEDRVIVEGLQQARPGSAVQPEEKKPEPAESPSPDEGEEPVEESRASAS